MEASTAQPIQSFFAINSWLVQETHVPAPVLSKPQSPEASGPALCKASPCASSSCESGRYVGSPCHVHHKTPLVPPDSRFLNPFFEAGSPTSPHSHASREELLATPHTTMRKLCFEEKEEELSRLRAENHALLKQLEDTYKQEFHRRARMLQGEVLELEALRRKLITSPDSTTASLSITKSQLHVRLLGLSRQSGDLMPPKEISYTTCDFELELASLPSTHGAEQPASSGGHTPSEGGLTVPPLDAVYSDRDNSTPGAGSVCMSDAQAGSTSSPTCSSSDTASPSQGQVPSLTTSTDASSRHTLSRSDTAQQEPAATCTSNQPDQAAQAHVPTSGCTATATAAAIAPAQGPSTEANMTGTSVADGWCDQLPLMTVRDKHMGPDLTPSPCAAPAATPCSVKDVKELFDDSNPLAVLTGIEMWAQATQLRLRALMQESQLTSSIPHASQPTQQHSASTCSASTQTSPRSLPTAAAIKPHNAGTDAPKRDVAPAAVRQMAWSQAVTLAVEPRLPPSSTIGLNRAMLTMKLKWQDTQASTSVTDIPQTRDAAMLVQDGVQEQQAQLQPELLAVQQEPAPQILPHQFRELHLDDADSGSEPDQHSPSTPVATPTPAPMQPRAVVSERSPPCSVGGDDREQGLPPAHVQEGTEWLLPFVQGQAEVLAEQAGHTQDSAIYDTLYPPPMPSDGGVCDASIPQLVPSSPPSSAGCQRVDTASVCEARHSDTDAGADCLGLDVTDSLDGDADSATAWDRFTHELLTLSPRITPPSTSHPANAALSSNGGVDEPSALSPPDEAIASGDASQDDEGAVVVQGRQQATLWMSDVNTSDQNPGRDAAQLPSSISQTQQPPRLTTSAAASPRPMFKKEVELDLSQQHSLVTELLHQHSPPTCTANQALQPELGGVRDEAPVMDVWTELAMELMQAPTPSHVRPSSRVPGGGGRPEWRPYPCPPSGFSCTSSTSVSPAARQSGLGRPSNSRGPPAELQQAPAGGLDATPCSSQYVAGRQQTTPAKRAPYTLYSQALSPGAGTKAAQQSNLRH